MGAYGEFDFDFEMQDDLAEISDPSPISLLPIQEVLRRHYHRVEQTKTDIINIIWTRDNLHHALRCLLLQDQFKTNILLILDALDEYAGPSEFIASILQDLDSVQAPSTRLRILFSSRPWKAFTREFANTPGFQIHEHTGNDIEEFCATQIPQDDSALHLLSPLVPKVVARAQGVFIWVKLVMSELSLMAVGGDIQMPHLRKELSRCLNSLPDELDEFYRLIIQRISHSLRWDSYVILEIISRFGELLSVDELVQMIQISNAKTCSEAQFSFISPQSKSTLASGSPQFLARSQQYLEAATGGLEEVVKTTSGTSENAKASVQFMHQSVQDFLQSSDLKLISLGISRARLVVENGYSFLSKYRFMPPFATSKPTATDFAAFGVFARQAEHTTGYSQINFFQPRSRGDFLPSPLEDHLGPLCAEFLDLYHSVHIRSAIELAVVHGLKLCLDDALKEEPQLISHQPDKNRPDLIGLLLMCTLQPAAPHGTTGCLIAVDTAEFLLTKGLIPGNNIIGLGLMIKLLWKPLDNDLTIYPKESKERLRGMHSLAETLVQAWSQAVSGEHHPLLLPTAPTLCSNIGGIKSCSTCGSSHLIERLLRLDLNTDGSSTLLHAIDHRMMEETPLDHALACLQKQPATQRINRHGGTLEKRGFTAHYLEVMIHAHAYICLLVQLGGKLGRTTKETWTEWTQMCVEGDLSIRVFEEKACPSWVDESYAADSIAVSSNSGSEMSVVDYGPVRHMSPMHSRQEIMETQESGKKERGRTHQYMQKVGRRMKALFKQD